LQLACKGLCINVSKGRIREGGGQFFGTGCTTRGDNSTGQANQTRQLECRHFTPFWRKKEVARHLAASVFEARIVSDFSAECRCFRGFKAFLENPTAAMSWKRKGANRRPEV
jgi:hypothetical protein